MRRTRRQYISVRPTETGITRVPLIPLESVDFLLEQSYSPKVTRLDRQPWGPTPGQDNQPRTGPIVTVEVPFTLVANAVALQIASADPQRTMLILQNSDPVNNLFYAFGSLANATSRFLPPLGASVILDVSCPTDRITVFATANVSGTLATMAPSG